MSNAKDERQTGTELVAASPAWTTLDVLALAAVALIAGVLFLNTLRGEWVYDDTRQIVRNSLIQNPATFGRAIMSDVWAFKGAPPGQRVSNYWRPTFVAWIAAHYHLFGLASTVAWHATNVLLHMLGTGLAYVVSRRLGLSTAVAAAIGLLFAVHPAHVESVAWISGSPDLLLVPLLLASLLLMIRSIGPMTGGVSTIRWAPWIASIMLFALAQGAKEVALFFPFIAAAGVWVIWRGDFASFRKPMLIRIAPLCAVSVAYVVLRPIAIGAKPPGAYVDFDLGSIIWNAPQVAAFYLRQVFAPYEIGPSYPIRAVSTNTMSAGNMWIPLAVCAVAGLAMFAAAKRWRIALFGLAIWVFTLGPAMNVAAFHPEQVVHDRYLYLPLLGVLLIALPAMAIGLGRVLKSERSADLVLLALCSAAAVPLAWQTVRYNAAWMTNVALWECGVKSDPTSGFNAHQLAVVLLDEAKRRSNPPDAALLDRAAAAAAESLRLDATSVNAWMVQGEIATEQKQWPLAERSLREALRQTGEGSQRYEVVQIYQRLAVMYERQGRRPEAESTIRESIRRLPQYRCMMTHDLAVVLYGQGRKAEALAELEAVRASVPAEGSIESRMVLYRLGQLYDESRRPTDAAGAYRQFMQLTDGMIDPLIRDSRKRSQDRLSRLGG